jgi:hypothetical protein
MDDLTDIIALFDDLRISASGNFENGIAETGKKLTLNPQEPSMARGSADQTAKDIAASLV